MQSAWVLTAAGLFAVHCQDVTVACAAALQDLARLGRWMAGKAVGLVLSGGGSRGLAHLGVLHALDDAGVPVDIIGGTSQVSSPTGSSPKTPTKNVHAAGCMHGSSLCFQKQPMHTLIGFCRAACIFMAAACAFRSNQCTC